MSESNKLNSAIAELRKAYELAEATAWSEGFRLKVHTSEGEDLICNLTSYLIDANADTLEPAPIEMKLGAVVEQVIRDSRPRPQPRIRSL